MVARHKAQVSPVVLGRHKTMVSSTAPPVISDAELVYVIPPGNQGYLALRDPTGALYLLKENYSFRGVKINSLKDNYLLVLLQNRTIEEIRERVSLSGHKNLEELFHDCVKNLSPKIDEAALDISALL